MSSERYVVLGLAHVRSAWFREVSRWATSAAIPLDFVKCVSVDELRARLASGRAFSAVIADAGLPGIDRDLVDRARELGCAVVLVEDGAGHRDLGALGISALLPSAFDRNALLATLDEHSSPIGAVAPELFAQATTHAPTNVVRGRLVAVTGAGGSGSSTTAMALARGLSSRPGGAKVLLADLALDADQAMLHDARDIVPGVQELAEAFRHGNPTPPEIEGLTFGDGYPYRVLLGLRRHRDWTALRPRAWHAALEGLRSTFTDIVADLDPDVEGEAECGSLDIEERNLLARTTTLAADVIVVTGTPSVQGIHRLVRLLSTLVEHGVAAERLQPVVIRAPRGGRARSEISRAIHDLLKPVLGPFGDGLPGPLFVGEQRKLDQLLRDGHGPPPAIGATLAAAVDAVAARAHQAAAVHQVSYAEPVPIVPGSLGSWAPDQEVVG